MGGNKTVFAAGGPSHLADINIAVRIDPDIVRREEVAGLARAIAAAKSCQQIAAGVEDADASAGC